MKDSDITGISFLLTFERKLSEGIDLPRVDLTKPPLKMFFKKINLGLNIKVAACTGMKKKKVL